MMMIMMSLALAQLVRDMSVCVRMHEFDSSVQQKKKKEKMMMMMMMIRPLKKKKDDDDKAWAVQRENVGSSPQSSHFVSKAGGQVYISSTPQSTPPNNNNNSDPLPTIVMWVAVRTQTNVLNPSVDLHASEDRDKSMPLLLNQKQFFGY